MRFKREISSRIEQIVRFFPALVLTGSRQSGKTTLSRGMFPDHAYASLDLPADAQLAEEDPDTFLAKYPPPVLIDEVQYAPRLFRHLKVEIDRCRAQNGRFILTGSQKFPLMKSVGDSLAGRCGVLELEPLSGSELGAILDDAVARHGLAYVLARGGYPQLWDVPDMPREDFFRSYVATYIERDVRQILNIASLRDFDRFIRVCAVRTGQVLNKSEIAKEVGVSAKTINDWLGLLHAGNQIVLLEPYFENVGKRVVKSPKLYFTDTGLVSFLLGLDHSNLLDSPHLGHLWETFVCAELRKYLFIHRPEASLWYYRDQQREADFVISCGGKLHLMDAKWKAIPTERDFSALRAIQRQFKQAAPELTLITSGKDSFPVAPGLQAQSGLRLAELVRSRHG